MFKYRKIEQCLLELARRQDSDVVGYNRRYYLDDGRTAIEVVIYGCEIYVARIDVSVATAETYTGPDKVTHFFQWLTATNLRGYHEIVSLSHCINSVRE
jgi:hypothetical protein